MIMSTKEICKRGLSMTISLTLGNTRLPPGNTEVADTELLGKLFLGQALFPPQLPQKDAEFLLIQRRSLLFSAFIIRQKASG